MISLEREAGVLSISQDGGPSAQAPPTQRLEIAKIDIRFGSLRLASPQAVRRLRVQIQSEGRIRDPLLVSTEVEQKYTVLVDGFKRLRVAQELGLSDVCVQLSQLDAIHAKAAILHRNQAREGLCEIEEAWIVRSLQQEQGMTQAQIAQLLRRHQSWVSRRLSLVQTLEERLQQDVRLGLLSVTTARELSVMPRGIQLQAAQAVSDHQLSSRQSVLLAKRLRDASDPQATQEVLANPWRYLASDNAKRTNRTSSSDPRLSEAGNQLRRALLSWEDSCGHLTRELRRRPTAIEAQVLAPVLQGALKAGKRTLKQLEATHTICNLSSPEQPQESAGEAAHA